jgi:acyl-CoA thioesterase-1
MLLRLLTLFVIGIPTQWSDADANTYAPHDSVSKALTADPVDRKSKQSSASILVLGDSISAAYGIDKALGWVALLEQRLHADCPGLFVHNASVSGETTAGGLIRLPDLLSRLKPSIVVIELGGNDGLRGLSPAKMQSNLQTMIRLARDAGAEPVLLGILIPPNYGEHYRYLFKNAIAQAAQLEQVALLDFFLTDVAGRAELVQQDGIHPTSAAQPKLLANALQILEEPLARICHN